MADFIFTLLPVFAASVLLLCLVVFSLQNKGSKEQSSESYGLVTLIAFVISCVISLYLTLSPWKDEVLASRYGQMGDYFGGMLNPILAFASFIALLYTIRIQSAELKLTRDELVKSADAQAKLVVSQEAQIKLQALLENYSSVKQLLVTNLDELRVLFLRESESDAHTEHRSIKYLYSTLDRVLIQHQNNIGIPTYWDIISADFRGRVGASVSLPLNYTIFYELAFSSKKQYERISGLAGAAKSDYFNASLTSYAELVSTYLIAALLYRPRAPGGQEFVDCSILCNEIRKVCSEKNIVVPPCLKLAS